MKYLNTSLLTLSVLVSSAVLAQCDPELMEYHNSKDDQKTLDCKKTILFQMQYDDDTEKTKFFYCGGVNKSPKYIINYMNYLDKNMPQNMPEQEPNLDREYASINHQHASGVVYINKAVGIFEICADYPASWK